MSIPEMVEIYKKQVAELKAQIDRCRKERRKALDEARIAQEDLLEAQAGQREAEAEIERLRAVELRAEANRE